MNEVENKITAEYKDYGNQTELLENKDIYNMDLHDVIEPHNGIESIWRVSGGWLYNYRGTSTFVPYSEEFKPKKETKPKKVIDPEHVSDVIRHLSNESIKIGLGKHPLKETPDRKRIVAALLRDYPKYEIIKVINYKFDEWKGTDNRKYLRGSTIFRKSNFARYLMDTEAAQPQNIPGVFARPPKLDS